MNSGEGVLDAIERCQKYHWVYNRRASGEKKTLKDAPLHFKQDSCMMPEATVFLLHGSHPFFEACGKEDASNPEDGLKITEKGTFKTCSSQRAIEAKKVKKELKAAENNKTSSAKHEAALTHAQAANKVAENSAITTKLQVIREARECGFSPTTLKVLMSQTLKSVFGERPTPSSAAKRDTTNDNEAASNLLRMATRKRKKTHHPPPSATSTSLSSRSTATKQPPVAEITLAGNGDEDDVIDLNACENPSHGGGTELNFSGCEDESQDLLLEEPVRKPKQSTVELLLLQQTQTTQESIAQQTSDTTLTLQFAAAGIDTQESLEKAREVGKQQALAYGATLSDDSSDDETDVDTCCANKYCRAKGMKWKPHHACNSCKGMVHLVCNRADQTGLEVCLECLSKAW